jgi:hypothetical protein
MEERARPKKQVAFADEITHPQSNHTNPDQGLTPTSHINASKVPYRPPPLRGERPLLSSMSHSLPPPRNEKRYGPLFHDQQERSGSHYSYSSGQHISDFIAEEQGRKSILSPDETKGTGDDPYYRSYNGLKKTPKASPTPSWKPYSNTTTWGEKNTGRDNPNKKSFPSKSGQSEYSYDLASMEAQKTGHEPLSYCSGIERERGGEPFSFPPLSVSVSHSVTTPMEVRQGAVGGVDGTNVSHVSFPSSFSSSPVSTRDHPDGTPITTASATTTTQPFSSPISTNLPNHSKGSRENDQEEKHTDCESTRSLQSLFADHSPRKSLQKHVSPTYSTMYIALVVLVCFLIMVVVRPPFLKYQGRLSFLRMLILSLFISGIMVAFPYLCKYMSNTNRQEEEYPRNNERVLSNHAYDHTNGPVTTQKSYPASILRTK